MKLSIAIDTRYLTLKGYSRGIGDSPEYENPEDRGATLRALTLISEIFQPGNIKTDHHLLEQYILCLASEENQDNDALFLFRTMTKGIPVHELAERIVQGDECLPVVNYPKRLGFEGMLAFAKLAAKDNNVDEAKQLLVALVEKIPIGKGSIRCRDVIHTAWELLADIETDAVHKEKFLRMANKAYGATY